jgi:hypothetical protein
MGVLIILDGGLSHLSSKSILLSKPLFGEYLIEIFEHSYSKYIDEILIVSNSNAFDLSTANLKTPLQIIRPISNHQSDAIVNLQYAITFLSSHDKKSQVYVSYSDIIIKSSLLDLVDNEAVNVFVDSSLPTFRHRNYCELMKQDGIEFEFIGMLSMTLETAQSLLKSVQRGSFVEQIKLFALKNGHRLQVLDIPDQWVHIENFSAVPGIMFGSKAQNLNWVSTQTDLRVPFFRTLKRCDMSTRTIKDTCEYFRSFNRSMALIVRSSHHKEDGLNSSNAGKFLSIGNLPLSEEEIESAVLKVFESYQDFDPNSEVMIQEQVSNIKLIGVLTSRTVKTMKPYFVIEYALDSQIDAITAGLDVDRKSLFIRRESGLSSLQLEIGFDVTELIKSTRELEEVFGFPALDIEFAIDSNDLIHILQVRPLVCDFPVFKKIEEAEQKTDLQIPLSMNELDLDLVNVDGKSLLSIMSDWNPAEILGRNPSALATSIYKLLVTDSTWSTQRFENGYCDLRGIPLMHTILGQNYIDVLASLKSFIPASISEEVQLKLLKLAYSQLRSDPTLHDRIEFQFFPTSSTLLRKKWSEVLSPYLSEAEISNLLVQVNRVTRINILRNLDSDPEPKINLYNPNQISSFSDYLKRYVQPLVLEFAHAARSAFVSKIFLNELIEMGVLTRERVNDFYASISTVTSDFLHDAWNVKSGAEDFAVFVEKYQHLRPSTYDLRSKSYGENFENYLRPIVESAVETENKLYTWTSTEIASIEKAIRDSELELEPGQLIYFLGNAIRQRERYKFEFTKGIDSVFRFIKDKSADWNFADHLPTMTITQLDEIFQSKSERRDFVFPSGLPPAENSSNIFEDDYLLPEVLFEDSSLSIFLAQNKTPYFPVQTVALGSALKLSENSALSAVDFEGKIICIESADPGYDFIFGLKVAGLVTAFGGPNSHMSVRCAELNLPSAIGLGSLAFNTIESGDQLLLDCVNLRFQNLSKRDEF